MLHKNLSLGAITASVLILAAACSGTGTLPSGSERALSPQIIGTCTPRVGFPCPTPKPTPTPYNGPVGASNNMVASANPTLLKSATLHVMYVSNGNTPDPMGDQVLFLKNLVTSSFFSYILKQYVPNYGTFAVSSNAIHLNVPVVNGYETENMPLGPQPGATCPPNSVPMDGNICQLELPITYYDQAKIMTAALPSMQAGTTSDVWHIIVPGDDSNSLCEQVSGQLSCWGPGSNMKNQCGEHDPIPIANGVLAHFTIQQDVPVCDTDSYADGISSTLSHELFETITDPDLSSGWHSGSLEIGDLCESVSHWVALPVYDFLNNTGTFYDIQPEWSNKDAHCYPLADQSPILIPLAQKHV